MSDPGAREEEISGREGGHEIARILVALDPSAHSLAALEAAVAMATRLGAELTALFVEDANIRRLAQLPFVQEVGFYTGSCRRVQTQELSRQLRVQAGRMRRRFRFTTRQIKAQCTFHTIRGHVVSEVLGAASGADVIILGKAAWSPFETERLTPDVREVLSQAPKSTLVLRAESRVEPPMRVVYDGTSLADKALATAAALVRDDDGAVVIFALADDPEEASRLKEKVRQEWAGTGLRLSFQTLSKASVSQLTYLMAHEEQGTLVLPAGAGALDEEAVLDFLDETEAPVLMVR